MIGTLRKLLPVVAFILLLWPPGPARAAPADGEETLGGQVRGRMDGQDVLFPVLKTDVVTDIQGDLATVSVTQTFDNPFKKPLHATYLFPLNKDAAVHAMEMQVGDEIVMAQIKEKQQARETFQKAKREGKAAALLEQHRPNMFTQDIANLMPGLPIRVTIKYTQAVPRVDGSYELVVPLIVGPRYQPEPEVQIASTETPPMPGRWEVEELPDYPHVAGLTIPDTIDKDRVSITVNLESDVHIQNVSCATHALDIRGHAKAKTAKLAAGRTVGNRDFVFRYRLAGRSVQAGVLTHRDRRGGFFSLMIEPPEAPKSHEITAREMVFVLDTSGSMSGLPVEASKTFMRHALKTLRPNDFFRIVRFSNFASEFSSGPMPATPENLDRGLAFVNGLSAGGGTEVPTAIRQAFSVRHEPGTMRIVVFLSDGYIGNEATVLQLVSEVIGEARIYAFGVGSGVNRYLLAEMARRGRGFARFIDPTEPAHDGAIALAQRLEAPVLTDIEVDWGKLQPEEVSPAMIPDLFAGDSLRLQGRFSTHGAHTVTVKGRVAGRPAHLPIRVALPKEETGEASAAIPLIWARARIADHMRAYTSPAAAPGGTLDRDEIKRKVIQLGLTYSLSTQWTSFVAVSKRVVNTAPESAEHTHVPLPMVAGVQAPAYGQAGPGRFTGGGTPEPEFLGGLLVLLLAGLGGIWRLFTRHTRRDV